MSGVTLAAGAVVSTGAHARRRQVPITIRGTNAGMEERVRDMAAVAEELRVVRSARRRFLHLWAIERAMIDPMVERLAADLAASTSEPVAHQPSALPLEPLDRSADKP